MVVVEVKMKRERGERDAKVLFVWVRTFCLERVRNERKRKLREQCGCESIWFIE